MNELVRSVLMGLRRLTLLAESRFDKAYLAAVVPTPSTVGHQKWQAYLYEIGNEPGMRILEVGSREVTGQSTARNAFARARYTGFDYYAGENVDVVGDAHRLSTYFDPGQRFDIVYSSACFEHFALPWVVAVEIAKVL